jgi:hypothetical protein
MAHGALVFGLTSGWTHLPRWKQLCHDFTSSSRTEHRASRHQMLYAIVSSSYSLLVTPTKIVIELGTSGLL